MSPSKERALQALLTQPTRKAAAAAAGISDRTLRGYFQDDEFIAEYRAAFSDLLDNATRQAQQSINPALSTLTEICQDSEAGPTVRVSAARALLEYGLRFTEMIDIATRLEELERMITQ